MRILFLTQYFPPEIGAPQNRLHDLGVRLKKLDVDVEVLTAMPNYPKMEIHEGYKKKKYLKEQISEITVYRSWIYTTKSKGVFKRLLNYFSFVFSSFWVGLFKTKKYDYILCESPPLFLGITAYMLCVFKSSKLIFNVSDLWPESAEKLDIVKNKTFLKIAYWLEKVLYKKATIITGQTKGIVDDIKKRYPITNPYWLPNGVDLSFFTPNSTNSTWREDNNYNDKDILFLYAGIIGHAQGLEVILNAAKLTQNKSVKYILIGDGPVKKELLKLKEELALNNVVFYDSISKSEIIKVIDCIDAVIVPLKKLDLFKGAIPSKIFENLAMKKPLLLGVDGEAKTLFIDEGNSGLFFEPENHKDLADKVEVLANSNELLVQLGENGRTYVTEKFNREVIAEDFLTFLNSQE
jgi:glycosyltransferase involved in cell wall biosynthesis